MTTSIFSTLGYNFDDSKYGDAVNLSEAGTKTLTLINQDADPLKDWQVNDMASGAADVRTNYYQNKQASNCAIIRAQAGLILTFANTYPFANSANSQNTMIASATNCIIELDKFKSHTDNVSGVSDPSTFTNSNAGDIPHFDTATMLSQQLLTLLNQTDSIANSTPLLGSMTSIFVTTEIGANASLLANDYITLNNTITTANDANGNTIFVSNVSSNVANTIIADLDNVILYMNTRRNHDWTFFVNGKNMLRRHSQVTKFSNMGDTQLHLINNHIGTDTLVANLSTG